MLSLSLMSPVHADTTVMLADGKRLERVSLKPAAAQEQIILEQAGQSPVTLPIQDLLVVDFGKIPGNNLTPSVRFANGDTVFGKVTFPSARQVKVAAGWGSITAPLNWVSAIRLQEKASLPGPVEKDTLVLPNDRVEGAIDGVTNGKVTVKVGGAPVPVELSRVSALAFASRPRAAETRPGLLLSLDLGGGERVTGRWVSLTPDLLTVRLEWGAELEVPVASLSRLEVKNGKLVYVSDLRPAEVKLTPYLDGGFSFRQDRSSSGRPLRLGGKTYARGLGTHSRTELTYGLDGGVESFAAAHGLDDAVGGSGSVVYRVYGDNRLLYESPVVRGGDVPIEIKLPVKGVLLLRLEVDFADGGDAADQANWAEARLLRP
ncbi:MAG: NPCBM/NEW2 domain-containing protein [Actinomycetota bacterium]